MRFRSALVFIVSISFSPCLAQVASTAEHPLTVVALGDAGKGGGMLRGNAGYLSEMLTGAHDGGIFDALVFLGNSFEEIGLNGPRSGVESAVNSTFAPFKTIFATLGRANVHGIPGNQDYYARYATERKTLFGLFVSNEGPTGFSSKGNARAAALDAWTYHYRMPGAVTYPLVPGSRDSAQFIFFDSALLLRTSKETWTPILDSLRTLLVHSAANKNIVWRILCTHHPLYTVGEHGGYTQWDDEDSTVHYVSPCDRDANAGGWLKNYLEADDPCADRYLKFAAVLREAVEGSGAKIHILLSAHDLSLQLLVHPDPSEQFFPGIQVVSGAASSVARVKAADPPKEFTSAPANLAQKGISVPGFVQIRFTPDVLTLTFFNGKTGDILKMGGEGEGFKVGRDGKLQYQEKAN